MAEEKQDGQKTIVAFVVGLLIGGMLVWAFSGSPAESPKDVSNTDSEVTDSNSEGDVEMDDGDSDSETDVSLEIPQLQVGNGEVVVNDQPASARIALESATYPVSEGWIGVRDYNDGQLGFILGVVRFSESQGLIPDEIILQRATTPGEEYAIVIFREDGDFEFNTAGDEQISEIFDTFVAQ